MSHNLAVLEAKIRWESEVEGAKRLAEIRQLLLEAMRGNCGVMVDQSIAAEFWSECCGEGSVDWLRLAIDRTNICSFVEWTDDLNSLTEEQVEEGVEEAYSLQEMKQFICEADLEYGELLDWVYPVSCIEDDVRFAKRKYDDAIGVFKNVACEASDAEKLATAGAEAASDANGLAGIKASDN